MTKATLEDALYFETENLGYFFVSIAPLAVNFSRNSGLLPNESRPIVYTDELSEACGSAVLSYDLVYNFQQNGYNSFMETLILDHLDIRNRSEDISAHNFSLLQQSIMPYCGYIDKESKQFVYYKCSENESMQTSGVLCQWQSGQVRNLTLRFDGNGCEELSNGKAALNFIIDADIVGPMKRNVSCYTNSFENKVIQSTVQEVEVSADVKGIYKVIIDPETTPHFIFCSVPVLPFGVSESLSGNYSIDAFYANFSFQRPDFVKFWDMQNATFLINETYFGQNVSVKLGIFIYPMLSYEVLFKEFSGPDQTATFSENLKMMCMNECTDPYAIIHIEIDLNFKPLKSSDTGIYTMKAAVDRFDHDNYFQFELVHPTKIWCDNPCEETGVGQSRTVNCSVQNHLISHYFSRMDPLPLIMKFHNDDEASVGRKPLFNCESNIGLEKTLETKDVLSYDPRNRSLMVAFEIFSVQEWSESSFYISLKVTDSKYCYIFGSRNCSVNVAYVNRAVDVCSAAQNNGFFEVKLEKRFGTLATRQGQCGSTNPDAFYFTSELSSKTSNLPMDENKGPFYRLCRTNLGFNSGDLCKQEGGEIVDQKVEDMVDPEERNLLSSNSSVYFAKVWRSMSCRAFYSWNPLTSQFLNSLHFVAIRGESPAPAQYLYKNDKIIQMDFEPSNEDNYVLCQYNRGSIWNMQKESGSCLHRKIDVSNQGVAKEKILMQMHGSSPVDVNCTFEDGTFQEFHIETSEPKEVVVSVPVDINQRKPPTFACYQILIPTEKAKRFNFSLSKNPIPIKVEPRIEQINVWCTPQNDILKQPCFGQDVIIRACVIGNPIDYCDWMFYSLSRLSGLSEPITIEHGKNGYKIDMKPTEEPQCNNTEICSNLTIQNLKNEGQTGFYMFKCYSGISDVPVEFEESKSKLIKIMAQQSAFILETPFIFRLQCSNVAKILGEITIYGQDIQANISCGPENKKFDLIQSVATNISNGVTKIEFELSDFEDNFVCQYSGKNIYVEKALTKESKIPQIVSSVLISSASESEQQATVCCESCAYGFSEREIKLFCYKTIGGFDIDLEATLTEFNYNPINSKYKKCISLTSDLDIGRYKCACMVKNVNSTASFVGTGISSEVEPATPAPIIHQTLNLVTVEPTTKFAPNVNNLRHQHHVETSQGSTSAPSNVVYMTKFENLLYNTIETLWSAVEENETDFSTLFVLMKDVAEGFAKQKVLTFDEMLMGRTILQLMSSIPK